jgi:hypothetical protein
MVESLGPMRPAGGATAVFEGGLLVNSLPVQRTCSFVHHQLAKYQNHPVEGTIDSAIFLPAGVEAISVSKTEQVYCHWHPHRSSVHF